MLGVPSKESRGSRCITLPVLEMIESHGGIDWKSTHRVEEKDLDFSFCVVYSGSSLPS